MVTATPKNDLATEERIKEAARIVFTRKGYSATRTRDIAEQAGLNLALLNYYFRSKEKLFEIIMIEKVQQLFLSVSPVFNDEKTTLEDKISLIVSRYIELLLKNPDLPLFVLSEIRNHPGRFAGNIRINSILESHFMKQLAEKKKDVNPVQLLTSMMGMIVFPFVSKPVFLSADAVSEEMFNRFMEERKQLIPQWLKMILE